MKDEWATRTHARLRRAQGDVRGAREILEDLLRRHPEDAEARALLASLEGEAARPAEPQAMEVEAERRPAKAASLATRFAAALGPGAGRPSRPGALAERLARWERALRRSREEWTMKGLLERLHTEVVPRGAVAVLDPDGLVIAGCAEGVLDEAVAVHAAESVRLAEKTARREAWGGLREQSLETDVWRLLWVRVDSDLGLLLYAPREEATPRGRWRHAARLAAADLAALLD